MLKRITQWLSIKVRSAYYFPQLFGFRKFHEDHVSDKEFETIALKVYLFIHEIQNISAV